MNKQELIDDIEKNKNEFYKLCTDIEKHWNFQRHRHRNIYGTFNFTEKD